MIIKLSRGGKFYSRINYPNCDGALKLDGIELEGPKETGEMCPECGDLPRTCVGQGEKREIWRWKTYYT